MEKRLRALESVTKDLIRVGLVSSINPVKATADVVFHEMADLVVTDLLVLSRNSFKNKDYQMPDIGEEVLCIFLPNGLESGFIIGSLYSDSDTPPESNPDKRVILFGDGTLIEYDRAAHKLTANINGTADITATTISINGNIILNGNLTASGTIITGGAINLNTHTHPDPQGGSVGGPQ